MLSIVSNILFIAAGLKSIYMKVTNRLPVDLFKRILTLASGPRKKRKKGKKKGTAGKVLVTFQSFFNQRGNLGKREKYLLLPKSIQDERYNRFITNLVHIHTQVVQMVLSDT